MRVRFSLALLFVAALLQAQNPNTAAFPSAVATDANLLVATNNAHTTLAAAINSTQTNITLASTTNFVTPMSISIDGEILNCPSHSGVTYTCSRHFDGSTAAAHALNAIVHGNITAWPINQLSAEVKAVETALGTNLTNALIAQCDISRFAPAGDGTTDDSAVFATAAGSCSLIILTQNKQYFIGTTSILAAGLSFLGNPSGGQILVGTGKVLTINGPVSAPALPIFALQGTGSVVLGSATARAPVEWFGALGDNSTDDTTAIQATINALTSGAATFLPKTYIISSALSVTKSHVGLSGDAQSAESTRIKTSSASIDFVDFLGTSVSVQIAYNFVRFIGLYRSTAPSGTATGVNASYTVHLQLDSVTCGDSIRCFYFTGNNNLKASKLIAVFAAGSSGSRYGLYFDGAQPNASIRVNVAEVVNTTSGTITYGSYHTGAQIKDAFIDGLESAGVSYGSYIASVSDNDYDLHFRGAVHDAFTQAGFYIAGLGSNGLVSITDAWTNPAATGATSYGVIVAGSASGVSVLGSQFFGGPNYTYHIGVYLSSCTRCLVSGNQFRSGAEAVYLNGSSNSAVVGNVMTFLSGQAYTAAIKLVSSSRDTISANVLDGPASGATYGINLDSASGYSSVTGNACNPGAYTTCFSNAGTANVITGVQN